MRRIFQIFESIIALYDEHGGGRLEMMNLEEVTRKEFALFGVEHEWMYCVANIR